LLPPFVPRPHHEQSRDDQARYLAFASGTTGDFTLTIGTTTTAAITYNTTPATLQANIEAALTAAGIGVKPTDPDGVKVTVSDDGLVVQLLFGKNFEDPNPWTHYDDSSMPAFNIGTTGLTAGSVPEAEALIRLAPEWARWALEVEAGERLAREIDHETIL